VQMPVPLPKEVEAAIMGSPHETDYKAR
jgi:hypothetical protein